MKTCKKCQGQNHSSAYRCRYCNVLFPEGQKLVAERRAQTKQLGNKKAIWDASACLYIIGGLFSLFGLFLSVYAVAREDSLFLHIPLTIGLSFFGLAIWSKKEEYWSILIGFILFSLIYIFLLLVSSFSVIMIVLLLPFEVYLTIALFKLKRKGKLDKRDILDA